MALMLNGRSPKASTVICRISSVSKPSKGAVNSGDEEITMGGTRSGYVTELSYMNVASLLVLIFYVRSFHVCANRLKRIQLWNLSLSTWGRLWFATPFLVISTMVS